MIPPEDAAALAAAIGRMADAPRAASEPGAAGRVFLEREHDREELAAAVLAVLEDAAGRRRAAGPGRDN